MQRKSHFHDSPSLSKYTQRVVSRTIPSPKTEILFQIWPVNNCFSLHPPVKAERNDHGIFRLMVFAVIIFFVSFPHNQWEGNKKYRFSRVAAPLPNIRKKQQQKPLARYERQVSWNGFRCFFRITVMVSEANTAMFNCQISSKDSSSIIKISSSVNSKSSGKSSSKSSSISRSSVSEESK